MRHRASLNRRAANHSRTSIRHTCHQACPRGKLSTSLEKHIIDCLVPFHGFQTSRAVADSAQPTASNASAPAAASAAIPTPTTSSPWRVYLGKMPLVGFEPLAAALKGTPAHQLVQLHSYVLLEGPGQVWYFDFLPVNPTSPATALTLLSAGSTPGQLRERKLSVTSVQSSSSVRFLGDSKHPDPLAAARKYSRSYNTQLHLVHNSCQHYTDGLIKVLLNPGTDDEG